MPPGEVSWASDRLTLVLSWADDRPVAVTALHLARDQDGRPPDEAAAPGRRAAPGGGAAPSEDPRRGLGGYVPSPQQPLVEVLAVGHGRAQVSRRTVETAIGARLRYAGHEVAPDGLALRVDQVDATSGLRVRSHLRVAGAAAGWSAWTELVNDGDRPVVLLAVTSMALRLLHGASAPAVDGLVLHSGQSEWAAENRWVRAPLRRDLVDLGVDVRGQDPRGRFHRRGRSSWSTGADLPVGVCVDGATGWAWGWQVEHNGPWGWEVGERRDGAFLALLGPVDEDNQWSLELGPGRAFTTVPVAVVVSADGLEGVAAELTRHRRALRASAGASPALPVVFNDYMNTVMGDPSTARLLPLVDAAADVGADVFCIDAGWYDDGSDWWDAVGEWLPSARRFPGGLEEVLAAVRRRGMTPGLWLEPEVVGVRSPIASLLPADAFLQRSGHRAVEHGRLHLDLRHPAARAHLDAVVDRLVAQGVGYLKLDYNITADAGTDVGGTSPGHGLLEVARAHVAWLDGVLARHPDLLVENCASGAMRQDYALLARAHLQSTSDQQDPARYPPIAAAAPLSVLPEQAASWSYPQPGMTEEEALFALAAGMLGRLYLSGNLDEMSAAQRAVVRDAVTAHRHLLPEIARAVPFWPLGLPGWTDPWVALGLHAPARDLLTLWRRGGEASTRLPFPDRRGQEARVGWLFPATGAGWDAEWDADGAVLVLRAPAGPPGARTLALTWERGAVADGAGEVP